MPYTGLVIPKVKVEGTYVSSIISDITLASFEYSRNQCFLFSNEFRNYALSMFIDKCSQALSAAGLQNYVPRSELLIIFNTLSQSSSIDQSKDPPFTDKDLGDMRNIPHTSNSKQKQHTVRDNAGYNFTSKSESILIGAKNMEPVTLMFGEIFSLPLIRNMRMGTVRRRGLTGSNDRFFHSEGMCDWCDIVRMRCPVDRKRQIVFDDIIRNIHLAVHAWHDTCRIICFEDFLVYTNILEMQEVPNELRYHTWIEEANSGFPNCYSKYTRTSDGLLVLKNKSDVESTKDKILCPGETTFAPHDALYETEVSPSNL